MIKVLGYFKYSVITFLSVLSMSLSASALSMQFIVTMPPVITKGSVAEFDVFGAGAGAQVFILILNNSDDLKHYQGLTLRYIVEYLPGSGGGKKRLYEGISYPFTMTPREQVPPISSKDFLKKNNYTVKVSLSKTLFELSDTDPLKIQFLNTQKIPDGKVRYTMKLEHGLKDLDTKTSVHSIINSSSVELISPGAAASESPPTEFNTNPLFLWTSDLPPNIYGNDDVYTIRIYKARSGESVAQAMSGIPVVEAGTKTNQYQVPKQQYRFLPGAVYYWEVVGYVKGLTTSEIKSSPFGFRMAKPVNPAFWEVITILKQVYGEDVLEKVYNYDAAVTIKRDGEVIDVGELRELVREIQADKYSIQSTQVD
jgi:hypothetical protein